MAVVCANCLSLKAVTIECGPARRKVNLCAECSEALYLSSFQLLNERYAENRLVTQADLF